MNAAQLAAEIGKVTRLRRYGKTWRGCCPFHDDKHPSFAVFTGRSTDAGLYHCFSCGETGNAITWARHIGAPVPVIRRRMPYELLDDRHSHWLEEQWQDFLDHNPDSLCPRELTSFWLEPYRP